MDVTLRQVECFVAVADHGAIARAAAALHASPSAVSAALDELERAVGDRLTVRRRAHGVTLTSAGRALLPRARTLLSAAHDLGSGGELRGRLAIGCYSTLAASLLPPLIEGFEHAHPGVALEFVEGDQATLLAALDEGGADALILYDRGLTAELATRQLFAQRAHVLVGASHPLAQRASVSLAELADEPFVQFDVQPAWQNTQALMAAAGVRPHVRYVTGDVELARSLVGRGLAYTVLVHRLATTRTHEGTAVVTLEIDPPPAPTRIVLAWRADVRPSAVASAFLDWAPGHLEHWPATAYDG